MLRTIVVLLLGSNILFGQSAADLVGRWNWSATCENGEARKGEFTLRRVSEESFRGAFLGTSHQSDTIGRGVFAVNLSQFEFQREYVTADAQKGIERWVGKVKTVDGAVTWTGTLRDPDTSCSFEATKQ